MSNELIFFIATAVDIIFTSFAARRGVEWLVGMIIANLIIVGIFGAKLIAIFGFITNAGNVFYACAFLAMHFILERHGVQEGMRALRCSIGFVFFFTILSQCAVIFIGTSQSEAANSALATVFSFSLRITIASITAYIFAQYAHIILYETFKRLTNGKLLWLRSNAANIMSQLLDSSLFFSIAFLDLSGNLLVQAILVGWFMKSLVVLIGTPFLYFDEYLEGKAS